MSVCGLRRYTGVSYYFLLCPPRLDSCVYPLSCCRSPVSYERHETNLTLKRQLTLTNLSRGIRPSLSIKPTHRPVPSQTAIATASAGLKRRRATPPTSLQPLPLNKILQSQQESHNPLVMAATVSLHTKEHCYSGALLFWPRDISLRDRCSDK